MIQEFFELLNQIERTHTTSENNLTRNVQQFMKMVEEYFASKGDLVEIKTEIQTTLSFLLTEMMTLRESTGVEIQNLQSLFQDCTRSGSPTVSHAKCPNSLY